MIKEVNGRFNDCSISPKFRPILLQLSYEIVENDLFFYSYKNELLLVQ